jgi:hypothetical protein
MKLKRKLVMKALTDPEFRKKLQENPQEALTKEELEEITGGADEVLSKADIVDALLPFFPIFLFCIMFPTPW